MHPSPSAAQILAIRALLAAAEQDADGLRRQASALSAATEWSARAADAYRDALGDLVAMLARLARLAGDARDEAGTAHAANFVGSPWP